VALCFKDIRQEVLQRILGEMAQFPQFTVAKEEKIMGVFYSSELSVDV
jgi:hypothetical protein